MSNIHGFHNINSAPRAGGPANSRYRQDASGGLPLPVGLQAEQEGISMMVPPPRADGLENELSERIFPRMTWKSLTTIVAIIDVIIFIIELIVGGQKYDGAFVKGNDMGGPSPRTLCNMGGKWEPDIRAGAVWRLFTAILLHAGVLHIASNLFFHLRFGYVTEARWGSARWISVYILAGIMASLWSTRFGTPNIVSVGASGALFGIVGADISYLIYNWAQIPHNRQEAFLLAIVSIINLLMGMSGDIDNWAHVGGLVGGLFLGVAIPPHLAQRHKLVRIAFAVGFVGLFVLFLGLIFGGNPWPEYNDLYGSDTSCW